MAANEKKQDLQRPITPQQIEKIQALAASIQYGTLTLVIQNGVLTQIDESRKIRL